uniref:DNA polymerase II subunit 2 n=1 Tax=Theileria annulata TaxID=5874 RepID=A0A3B0NA43_THEAN
MEVLFTQYEDSPIIYDDVVDPQPHLDYVSRKTNAHLIVSNLIKYGINLRVSEDILQHLSDKIISESPTFYSIQFDEDVYVDSRVWNHLILSLYNTKLSSIETEQIDSIINEITTSELYIAQNKFIESVNNKFPYLLENNFGNKFNSNGVYVYNSFKDVPKVYYSTKKQKFLSSFSREDYEKETHGDPIDQICSIRYQLLLERCRGYNFNEWIGIESHSYLMAVTVDSVSFSSEGVQLLIGNLSKSKYGDLCIQGSLVELKIKIAPECKISTGIYCYGQVVIVYGVMISLENVFEVRGLTHPPLTPKDDVSHLNLFGGHHNPMDLVTFRELPNMLSIKNMYFNWFVITDLHLDKTDNINQIERLFNSLMDNYSKHQLPVGFIFMGNFNSSEYNFDYYRNWTDTFELKSTTNSFESYSAGFEALFKVLTKPKFIMILASISLPSCYLVFVPGPKDATLCRQRVPRNPLLSFATNRFKERLESSRPECKGRVIMATNPCRIRHWGRRMIFFRHDIMSHLLLDSIITTSNYSNSCQDLSDMLVETIVGQSHLLPNKPGLSTVLNHDSSLLLHSLPDLICLGDSSSPAFVKTHGIKGKCTIANCDSNSDTFKNVISYDSITNKINVIPVYSF